LRVVQFPGIGKGRAVVTADFRGAGFTGIPTPRQAELPGTPVTTEKRAESAELEPAQVELCREFLCGNEAANVRAPVGNAGEPGVDSNRNVGFRVSQVE
jgi:hypothetical protein